MNPVVTIGRSSPLGATVTDSGANFSLFSRSAIGVELLLFDREGDAPLKRPSSQTIAYEMYVRGFTRHPS